MSGIIKANTPKVPPSGPRTLSGPTGAGTYVPVADNQITRGPLVGRSSSTVPADGTVYFTADLPSTWEVVQAGGGTLATTPQAAAYTAPAGAGTYTIRARAVANPSLYTDVTVTVT